MAKEAISTSRTLLIMRHAEAEPASFLTSDHERKLTEKGKTEAGHMGIILVSHKLSIQMIYTSSALRTKQTAEAILKNLPLQKTLLKEFPQLYNSPLSQYINILSLCELHIQTLMIVGHNPTISLLVEYLTNHDIQRPMPPASIYKLEINASNWSSLTKGCGKVITFLTSTHLSN